MRPVGTKKTALVAGLVASLGAVVWVLQSQHGDRSWPVAALPSGNLLLVTIDTLRADRITSATAPNLTRLAHSGHRYRTAYTHAPLTLPAHASILTGLLPRSHGARGNGAFRLDPGQTTMAERLSSKGYRTGAFVGAFVLDARFGLDQGFDRYDGVDDDRAFAADFGFAERRAPDVLAAAESWIREVGGRGPWFAWVHLFDPHAPYAAPGSSGPASYDDEVRFVDRSLGQFLDRLEHAKALERTLVIVTADHGESLGEHGEKTHGLFAYEATMRVPLIMSGPGLGAAEHSSPVSHIDIVPTALELLGVPIDPALPGRSLRLSAQGSSESRPIHLEALDGWLSAGAAPVSAVVQDGWKFIESPIPELYHLESDPRESQNLFGRDLGHQQKLEATLRAIDTESHFSTTVPVDREVDAKLRSLGYAASGAPLGKARFEDADDAKRMLPTYERFLSVLENGGRDVAALQQILAERPSFAAARMVLAAILIERNQALDAVRLLDGVADGPAGSPAMRERLGAAYLAAGQFDRAATIFQRVVAEPGSSADAWNGLGAALAQSGHPADARRAFDQAVGLAPKAARIRLNRALAALQTGDRAVALADLTDLTAQQPRFADAWRLLATLRHESGDKAGALDAWQRLLAVNANDLDTLFNLAVTYRDLGHIDQAREAANRFAAVAPRPAYNRELATLADLTRR